MWWRISSGFLYQALLLVVLVYAERERHTHTHFWYHLLPPSFLKAKQTGVVLAAATDVFSPVGACVCHHVTELLVTWEGFLFSTRATAITSQLTFKCGESRSLDLSDLFLKRRVGIECKDINYLFIYFYLVSIKIKVLHQHKMEQFARQGNFRTVWQAKRSFSST